MSNTKLFNLLSSINSLEVLELKTYKQAISNQNLYHNDWKAVI